MKGYKIWRLIFTTCKQPEGAPIFDKCFTRDTNENRYKGIAVLLSPWKKNIYKEHIPQRAFVVGWKEK